MNRGRWQQNHWPRIDRLTESCPMALSRMASTANHVLVIQLAEPPHIIKSTPAWWRWCLEFALRRRRGKNCEHFATFWIHQNRIEHDNLYLNIPSCFPWRRTNWARLDFLFPSIWSCFLVLRRGETSPHPHKETLLARLLTCTQVKGPIWASLKTFPPSKWQSLTSEGSR